MHLSCLTSPQHTHTHPSSSNCHRVYEIWPCSSYLSPFTATTLNSLPFLRNYPISCFTAFAETGSPVCCVSSISTPSRLQFSSYLSELTSSVPSSRKPSLTTPTLKTRLADPPICFHSVLNFIRAPNTWYYNPVTLSML